MMPDISRDEWNHFYQMVEKGFEEVKGKLDRMNGQVKDHHAAIAVLEDRTVEMRRDANVGKWLDRAVGAIIAGFLYITRH